MYWQLKTKRIELDNCPKLMGILNTTPDSFSDGGSFNSLDRAVEQAMHLSNAGAAIIDIGGESTRPYSEPVSIDEELNRVIPVIEQVVTLTDVPVSIDTSKAVVAAAAMEAGAEIINDVTGLEGDPDMIRIATETGAGICAMHMQGNPQNMQDNPSYDNVVSDIHGYLRDRRDRLLEAGIRHENICLDPGIGFGKTHDHNLTLMQNCFQFLQLGCPILVGHSRKGFIAHVMQDKESDRMPGTAGAAIALAEQGIHVIRVHDVLAVKHAVEVYRATRQTHGPEDRLPG